VLDKSKFVKQTENAIKDYFSENVNEQSLLRALANFDLYQKQYNTFFEYFKDWFCLHNSKLYNEKKDNYQYVKYIAETELEKLQKDTYLSSGLPREDLNVIKNIASLIISVYSNTSKLEAHITKRAKELYPNLVNILGPLLTVRFLNQAHSLKRLSSLPASTLQLFGAENAMFKHLKFGKSCPKYGLLYLHPLMSGLNPKQKGKLARCMADKISLASRYDYAKKSLHKELLEYIEKKKASICLESKKYSKHIQVVRSSSQKDAVLTQTKLNLRESNPKDKKTFDKRR